jgi:hypothetical protein
VEPPFDAMNETDVREVIVRPLIERLGYKYGTQAHIRTEVQLKYDKAFLGHKKKTDTPLAGRADYICDAISYGRWAVEVKKPSVELTQDDVEQAHTYCAHPEIGAHHFLLTNGKDFRLYVTGQLEKPLLEWKFAETEQHVLTLLNILGYEAIKRRAAILRPDVNKPLGEGLASKLRIIAGEVAYGDHHSDHPLFKIDALTGKIGTITGGFVERAADGRLHARVIVRGPYQDIEKLNKLAGIGDYDFWAADEYISTDKNIPTVCQNVLDVTVPAGTPIRLVPGIPEIPLPMGFQSTVYTEAIAYFDGEVLTGFLSFDYDYTLVRGRLTGNLQIDNLLANVPSKAKLIGEGTFKIITAAA